MNRKLTSSDHDAAGSPATSLDMAQARPIPATSSAPSPRMDGAARWRGLETVLEAAVAGGPVERVLARLVGQVRTALQADRVLVLTRTDDGQSLSVPVADGLANGVAAGTLVPVGHGLIDQVVAHGRDRHVADIAAAGLTGEVFLDGMACALAVPLRGQEDVAGAMLVASANEDALRPEDLSLLRLAAGGVGRALEHARLLAAEQEARAGAQAAERRARLLAAAGRVLASSLDYAETLKRVARLAAHSIADWCLVEVLEPDDGVARFEVAARDRRKERIMRAGSPTLLLALEDERNPLRQVTHTGRSLMVGEVTEAYLESVARDDDHLRLLQELNPTSFIAVPLVARDRTLGGMSFVAVDHSRQYDDQDLEFAEALAARAALAIDNAQLYREAQRANEAKSTFLRNITHELRTPLATIMGYVQLLEAQGGGPLTEEQEHQLSLIRQSAEAQQGMIDEIMTFCRIDAGHERVNEGSVDVVALTRACVMLAEREATARGLELTTQLPGQPVVCITDEAKVRRILLNLLGNAIKFTESGTVQVQLEATEEDVAFTVRDTGRGIDPAHHGTVFEPFWQERPENGTTGTGLGLSIVQRLVERLGGSVYLTSTLGQGSAFTVRLPRDHRGDPPTAG